jgi:hypothetical protein
VALTALPTVNSGQLVTLTVTTRPLRPYCVRVVGRAHGRSLAILVCWPLVIFRIKMIVSLDPLGCGYCVMTLRALE